MTIGTIVLPSEGDAGAVAGDQPAVGDGDAVSIARQIGQHGLWPAERALGIDHPFGSMALTAWGLETIGWRNTMLCMGGAAYADWPAAQLFHATHCEGRDAAGTTSIKPHIAIDRTMILLALPAFVGVRCHCRIWECFGQNALELRELLVRQPAEIEGQIGCRNHRCGPV